MPKEEEEEEEEEVGGRRWMDGGARERKQQRRRGEEQNKEGWGQVDYGRRSRCLETAGTRDARLLGDRHDAMTDAE